MTLQSFTDSFPHTLPIKLAWGEMDALAHVNNIIYFRYMESARIHFFETLEFALPTVNAPVGPILAQIECQFISPVSYPDDLIIGSRIHSFGRTSMKMEHSIYSSSQNRVVAKGDSVIVMIDYNTMQKTEIPPNMRETIDDFQNGAAR